ncbi:hypothetical protein GINT2_000808 [Glugoides intestinalis]
MASIPVRAKRESSKHLITRQKKHVKRGKPAKYAATENTEEDEAKLKKSMLINTAVVTVRNPSKRVEALCKQLRKILTPNCLMKLEINPKVQDLVDVSEQLLLKQIIYISEKEIQVACLPSGPTHHFNIADYRGDFKNFANDLYKNPPFITTDGKSELKPVFQAFGSSNNVDRRSLHFHFRYDLIHIRHFLQGVETLDDKFKVKLKEIGPRLSLKFIETKTGIFPKLSLEKPGRRAYRLKIEAMKSTSEQEARFF